VSTHSHRVTIAGKTATTTAATVPDPDLSPYAKQSDLAALTSRVAALEAAVFPPVQTEVVKAFPAGGTAAQMEAMAADTTIDAIEMAAGTYRFRGCDLPDRSARPLTIRPAKGAAVVFSALSDGDYGDRAFGFQGASHITIDGSAGSITLQDYALAQDGLFLMINAHAITLRALTMARIGGNSRSNEQSSHLFYVSRDCGGIDISGVTASSMGPGCTPGAVYGASGLHVYTGGTGASVSGISLRSSRISGANWGVVLRNAATGVVIDGVVLSGCGHAVPAALDASSDCKGTVSNTTVIGSAGTPVVLGGLTDAGGNAW
jgi:hypothetical protein